MLEDFEYMRVYEKLNPDRYNSSQKIINYKVLENLWTVNAKVIEHLILFIEWWQKRNEF